MDPLIVSRLDVSSYHRKHLPYTGPYFYSIIKIQMKENYRYVVNKNYNMTCFNLQTLKQSSKQTYTIYTAEFKLPHNMSTYLFLDVCLCSCT